MYHFSNFTRNQINSIQTRLMPNSVNFRPAELSDKITHLKLKKVFTHNNLAYEKIAVWANRNLYAANITLQNLTYNCAQSGMISILDLLDHYIQYTTEDVADIKAYRETLLQYDKGGLMTKPHYFKCVTDTRNVSSSWHLFGPLRMTQAMHSNNLINRMFQTITMAKRREFVGDRLKYLDFSSMGDDVSLLGITPTKVADLMIAAGRLDEYEFRGLKNFRHTLINYLSQKEILVYWHSDDDIEVFRDDLWVVFSNITSDDPDLVFRSIEAVIIGMYFSNYQQWMNDIKIGNDEVPTFSVHEHTFIAPMFEEDHDGIWGIDWSLHPKDNFKDIIDDLINERAELLKVEKPVEQRKAVALSDVCELVTAQELVAVGNRMNICIGGDYYVNGLLDPNRSYYQIGSGNQAVIIELYKTPTRYQIRQAVTYSNNHVTEDNPNYATMRTFEDCFDISTNAAGNHWSIKSLNDTINYAVVSHMHQFLGTSI